MRIIKMNRIALSITITLFVLILFSGCEPTAKENKEAEKESNDNVLTKENIDTAYVMYIEEFKQFRTHNDLVEHFGEENVKKKMIWKEEGTVKYPVSIVFPKSSRQLKIYWKQGGDEYSEIQFVELEKIIYDYDDGSVIIAEDDYWKCKNGLMPGMTIQELEKLNGGVFEFYGLDWDYGGSVITKNEIFNRYKLTLGFLRLDTDKTPQGYDTLVGDAVFKSDNSVARSLPLKLVKIVYYFTEE